MNPMTAFLKTMPAVLGLILGAFIPVFGQDVMKIKHSCNFDGEETTTEHYTFEASSEATKIVNTLLQASGLSANGFILKESDCKNALATTNDKKRYILYNPVFLQKFKTDAKSKWVAYCVLAHEIAHHLNNHDLETDDPSVRKRQELEADMFAGHWLAKMGATLEEAQAGIKALPLENDSKTHPPKNARLVAVTNGWTKARENKEPATANTTPVNSSQNTETTPTKRSPKEITVPTGYSRCGECEGHGTTLGTRWCRDCSGQGKIAKKLSCSNCKGTGSIMATCWFCKGTKKNSVSESPCNHCSGTGQEKADCKVCSGDGYVRDNGILETCTTCNGTKRVPSEDKCKHCKGKGFVKI
jgi:IrrE N-terminal-like domain